MSDMATLQRLGQEFERPRAAVGGFPYAGHRTVAEIDRAQAGPSGWWWRGPVSHNTPIRPGSGSASRGVGVGSEHQHGTIDNAAAQ